MSKATAEEIQGMRETLIVLGTKSETYYLSCTPEQIEREYNRFIGADAK